MKNAVYGQSGGPTSVINASLYGVIQQCGLEEEIGTLYLMHNGIRGLIDNDLKDVKDIPEEQIELLPFTPGAICGSVRYKLKDYKEDDTDYKIILENLIKNDIHYIFLNGGNDSMDTCSKISSYLKSVNYDCKVIGIPKTIDNDLVCTDHTPGYGSAAKFIVNSVQSIAYDNLCYPKGRVNIVEIMGRDTGWLTASSGLASITGYGPDLIYVPEIPFDMNKFLEDVKRIYTQNKRCMVAVSEGIRTSDGEFVFAAGKDAFAHKQLGGVGQVLASMVEKELGFSTRAIELSLLQRCYAPSLSQTDGKEAIKCGKQAVKLALSGVTDVMVGMRRDEDEDYAIYFESSPLGGIANAIKYLPREYMNEEGNNITYKFIDYAYPLIGGKTHSPSEGGISCYADKRKF